MCPMRLSDRDPDRKWRHMSQEVFQRIRKEVFPLARTAGISCGAEPLTNPSFSRHLEALYKSGVPYREMVTNGTLLTDEWIDTILRFPPTAIFVSIDGATDEVHGRIRDRANLAATIAMLKKLIGKRGRNRFPMLSFSTTLQRDNLHQMKGIVELAAATGAEGAGFVPLVPYEGLDTLGRTVDMNCEETLRRVEEAKRAAIEKGIRFSFAAGTAVRAAAHPCPYLNSTIYIDPNGSVFPCAYWNTGKPLGNVMDGFNTIWKGFYYRRLRNGNWQEGDSCLNCPEVTQRKSEVKKARS